MELEVVELQLVEVVKICPVFLGQLVELMVYLRAGVEGINLREEMAGVGEVRILLVLVLV